MVRYEIETLCLPLTVDYNIETMWYLVLCRLGTCTLN